MMLGKAYEQGHHHNQVVLSCCLTWALALVLHLHLRTHWLSPAMQFIQQQTLFGAYNYHIGNENMYITCERFALMEMFLNIPLYSSRHILHVPSVCGFTSFSSPSFALDSLCILKELLLSKFSLFVSLFFPPFSQGFPMSSSFLSVCSCFSDFLWFLFCVNSMWHIWKCGSHRHKVDSESFSRLVLVWLLQVSKSFGFAQYDLFEQSPSVLEKVPIFKIKWQVFPFIFVIPYLQCGCHSVHGDCSVRK